MLREEVLLHAFLELSDETAEDYDVIDVLTTLSTRYVSLFGVATAGVMLAGPAGALRVVASSSDAMRALELLELQADEGPCVDAYRTGQAVVNVELSVTGGRWPRFTPRALAEGFRTTHALPLRRRDQTIGAINLFNTDNGGLSDADVLTAQALADVAAITVTQQRGNVDGQVSLVHLHRALNSRIVIEQAKGRISGASDLDTEQAFQQLRGHAHAHRVRLTDLSRDVVAGTVMPGSLDPLVAAQHP